MTLRALTLCALAAVLGFVAGRWSKQTKIETRIEAPKVMEVQMNPWWMGMMGLCSDGKYWWLTDFDVHGYKCDMTDSPVRRFEKLNAKR